jgi:hypothetical protein
MRPPGVPLHRCSRDSAGQRPRAQDDRPISDHACVETACRNEPLRPRPDAHDWTQPPTEGSTHGTEPIRMLHRDAGRSPLDGAGARVCARVRVLTHSLSRTGPSARPPAGRGTSRWARSSAPMNVTTRTSCSRGRADGVAMRPSMIRISTASSRRKYSLTRPMAVPAKRLMVATVDPIASEMRPP